MNWLPDVGTKSGRAESFGQAVGAAWLLATVNFARLGIDLWNGIQQLTVLLGGLALCGVSLYFVFSIRKNRSKSCLVLMSIWGASEFVLRLFNNQILGGVIMAIVVWGGIVGCRAAFSSMVDT
jgi:hypothetical protein